MRDFQRREGRDPTDEELAAELAITLGQLERLMFEANTVATVSLHKAWYETDSLKDVFALDRVHDRTVAEPSRRLEAQDELREALRGCSTTERLILIGYYCEDDTMKEVGASLGMSESRVSQIHSALVTRLRKRAA